VAKITCECRERIACCPQGVDKTASSESEHAIFGPKLGERFLGNAIIRKVVRGLCVDDRQAIYRSFELVQWPKRPPFFEEGSNCADLCVRRTRANVLPRGQGARCKITLSQQGDAARPIEYHQRAVAEYGISKPLKLQAPFLSFGTIRMRVIYAASTATRCRQNVKG